MKTMKTILAALGFIFVSLGACQNVSNPPWTPTAECTWPDKAHINATFNNIGNGSIDNFWAIVADNVSWTVMGSHPLAGHYSSLATFLNSTTDRLAAATVGGGIGNNTIWNIIGGCVEEWSVIEMIGQHTFLNGMPYDNQLSWSTRWNTKGIIEEVHGYVNGAIIALGIFLNEITTNGTYLTERTNGYDGTCSGFPSFT
ncbi:hypothetical protein B7463_g12048, partial [Scytalidium lignicola]